jgi:phospholipase C
MHAATSVGFVHNPWEHPIEARTIYQDIDEQGEKDWAFYYFDLSDSDNFPELKKRHDRVREFSTFYEDLKTPLTFPNYSFLCPRYVDSEGGFANSQHAPYDVRYGEQLIADVYEALRKSEIWEKTLLVVTYDEHGGFYDHVLPPNKYILPPDAFTSPTPYDKQNYGYMFDKNGRAKKQYQFNFDRLGARVPTVLISPWIEKESVESKQLQHTSVLATVRKMWGLRKQPLTAREGQAKTFDVLLEKLSAPRKDCPLTLKRPSLPERSLSAALDQPLSPVQREVFAQVNHLDGHEESGTIAAIPKTQREATNYFAQRRKAHQAYHKSKSGSFNIYKDSAGNCRWRLIDGESSEIVASSGQGFANVSDVKKEIERVRTSAAGAAINTEK